MKEMLESLVIEDGKLNKEQVKSIIAKNGEMIKVETEKAIKEKDETIETYKTTIQELQEQSKDSAEWKTKFEELDTKIKEQEAQRKAEEEEKSLQERFDSLVGDKKFTNDYARKGLYNDFKAQLSDKTNKGKGDKEIFDTLTKDQNGMFESDNKVVDMPSMGDGEQSPVINEMPTIW